MFRYKKSERGFTLIEVLVALGIIALALGAIISSSGSQAEQTLYLKQKTIAHWVALNAITRIHIENEWPELGVSTGSETMANHEWHWKRLIKKSEDERSRQVNLEVYADSAMENKITTLSAFIIDNR